MTAGEMLGYTNRYKQIMSVSNTDIRDVRLAQMLKDILEAYTFDKTDPFLWSLYWTVSDEMSF